MMPHEPVLDIMRRTMANLAFIEQRASSDGPFEVTQLINSFLGALAHPWETLRKELNSISISDAESQGWPIPQPEPTADQAATTLGDLIRLLRNGVAHGNISFLRGGHGQIAALQIENRNSQGRRTWGVIVTPETMRRFLERFVALVEDLDKHARQPSKIA
jgi:HEPN pEK499 p136